MAGTIIADKIQTENAFLTLNVGATQIATMNTSGIYSSSGTKMIGTDGTIGVATIANTAITGNIISSQIAPSVTLTTPIISGNLNLDSAGTTGVRVPSANTISFHTAGTEDMRIDANGNMGIGGTVDNHGGYGRCLQISASAGAALEVEDGSSYSYFAQNGTTLQIRNNDASGNIVISTNATERTRIASDGAFLIGKTAVDDTTEGFAYRASKYLMLVRDGAPPLSLKRLSDNGEIAQFYRIGTQVGSISVTASATAYNTSSDYRLKKNITPMTGALAKVAQLTPVTYKWKADDSDGEGFIAHELAEVCPHAVNGDKDAVDDDNNPIHQGIDVSFLVATLTAAIQEQQAIISDLKARIEALEA